MLGTLLPCSKPALATDERGTGTFVLRLWSGGADVHVGQQESADPHRLVCFPRRRPQRGLRPVARLAPPSQALVVLTEALQRLMGMVRRLACHATQCVGHSDAIAWHALVIGATYPLKADRLGRWRRRSTAGACTSCSESGCRYTNGSSGRGRPCAERGKAEEPLHPRGPQRRMAECGVSLHLANFRASCRRLIRPRSCP